MKYMLDTNICIYAIKRKPLEVLQRFQRHQSEGLCISSIVLGELEYGNRKSKFSQENRVSLAVLLSRVQILPFDRSAAEEYGLIRAALEQAGTPIGPLDMLIAAHARSLGLTLITNNTREFRRVADLSVEDWTSSLQGGTV